MPNAVHWPVQNVDSGLHVLAIVFSLSPITPEVSDYATTCPVGTSAPVLPSLWFICLLPECDLIKGILSRVLAHRAVAGQGLCWDMVGGT